MKISGYFKTYIITSILFLSFSGIYACKEKPEEKETTKTLTKKETQKTVEKGEIKEEKKEGKSEQLKQVDYNNYKVYPWELLKDKRFKESYIKAIGKLKNIYWIRDLNGVAPKNKIIEFKGEKFVYIEMCKPHSCDTENLVLLYEPINNRIFGIYLIDKKKIWIGNPNSKEQDIFLSVIEKTTPLLKDSIKTAKVITPQDLGIKETEACPIYKEVELNITSGKKFNQYANMIWHYYIEPDNPPADLVSKKDIRLGLTDLNDDGKLDILFTVENGFYCGSAGCHLEGLINLGKNKYKHISILSMGEFDKVYISKNKTNGLRDLILNEHQIYKFDGNTYKYGGECYVN